MPNWIIPKDAARGLVDHGTQRVQKSIQTVKKALPLQEEPVVLIRVSSGWTRLETGGYRATGVMIGASGKVRSGEVFVYAPTAASADDLPSSGKRIHAAKVNGRWEMIQGGSGGAVDLYAGEGISIDEPEYTITNTGVLSLTIANTYASFRGDVKVDNKYFTARDGMISLNRIKGYGAVEVAQISENEVEITFGVNVEFA